MLNGLSLLHHVTNNVNHALHVTTHATGLQRGTQRQLTPLTSRPQHASRNILTTRLLVNRLRFRRTIRRRVKMTASKAHGITMTQHNRHGITLITQLMRHTLRTTRGRHIGRQYINHANNDVGYDLRLVKAPRNGANDATVISSTRLHRHGNNAIRTVKTQVLVRTVTNLSVAIYRPLYGTLINRRRNFLSGQHNAQALTHRGLRKCSILVR